MKLGEINALEKMLANDYAPIRKVATKALGNLKDIKAIEPLIKALSDEDFDVRSTGKDGLEQFSLG